jgi:hypothetical protein
MKKIQKVTRLRLHNDESHDYILLGLVSAEPDYKLSLLLNKKLGISLKTISSLKIHGIELVFSRFSSANDIRNNNFNLISNRTDKAYLLNKLKNIDYLLQIMVSENESDLNKITSKLREVDAVTAVFNIDIKTLKDKNLHYLNL